MSTDRYTSRSGEKRLKSSKPPEDARFKGKEDYRFWRLSLNPRGEASREHGWKPTIRLLNRFHTKSYQTLCFKPQASPVAFFILKVKPQNSKLKTQNSKPCPLP